MRYRRKSWLTINQHIVRLFLQSALNHRFQIFIFDLEILKTQIVHIDNKLIIPVFLSRFGVTIYFGSPDKKAFQNIVRVLAQRSGIVKPEAELLAEANKWELIDL